MTTTPWLGDACSLVDALRARELSPLEVLDASLAALDASTLNAVCYRDDDAARDSARHADVSLPFGGVPIGVKELEHVRGWPATEASLVFKDDVATYDSTQISRLRAAGAVLAAQTTAPEFGGTNYTRSKLHGVTRNPWNEDRTPGGSSGGTAASVAGGLLPIGTGGDGGGSIRIPAGFSGLVGLKATYGRIPRGPRVHQPPHTVTTGCLSRSVRDTARWFDVCNGYDVHDTQSLPRVEGWEAGLGTREFAGLRAAVVIDLGVAVVEPDQAARLEDLANHLIARAGLRRVDVAIGFPLAGFEWTLANLIGLAGQLGDRYPDCEDLLTPSSARGMKMLTTRLSAQVAGAAEEFRVAVDEHNAEIFSATDFVFCATNPDVAFAAAGPMPTSVGDIDLVARDGFRRAIGNNGALTIPANFTGNPAISVPAGTKDGLPFGLQIIGRHHEEPLLLDLARMVEQDFPWPLVAPTSLAHRGA